MVSQHLDVAVGALMSLSAEGDACSSSRRVSIAMCPLSSLNYNYTTVMMLCVHNINHQVATTVTRSQLSQALAQQLQHKNHQIATAGTDIHIMFDYSPTTHKDTVQ